MSKKKKAGIVLLVFLALLAAIACFGYFSLRRYYKSTNYMSDEEVKQMIQNQLSAKEDDIDSDENETKEPDTDPVQVDEELLAIQQRMEKYAATETVTTDGNVYNILLIGVDTTDGNFIGNSDSMILISVNYHTHKISMVSLMRDTHVYIPNIGYRKLNAAHANGGGPLLIETIEYNYKIDIDRYVSVDFGNMIDIIDEIGTVEITFTDAEAKNANKSIKQQCKILGLKYKDYALPGGGTYECNGMQTVAYARIRKVGNADYQRTERQREVLMKLLDKVKEMDLGEIDKLATHLLPMLTHNIPENEFWGLLAKVPNFLSYEIVQDRVPYNGKFVELSNGNLAPDWEYTVSKLKSTLYGEPLDIPDDDNGEAETIKPDGEQAEDPSLELEEKENKKELSSPYEPKIFTFYVTSPTWKEGEKEDIWYRLSRMKKEIVK